ncbi:MAG: hypothetical protein HQ522_09805 [Bacteroidetes bacterium]|nr:hypothetical protein [Bacteroidota bacterium]
MKKWGIGVLLVVIVAGLYYIEFSKIDTGNLETVPTLDELEFDSATRNWDNFYRVRATIIDGQSAKFSIPENLKLMVGKEMELSGAAVFFSPGCTAKGDKIAVHSFFLLPTLGLANACEHLPEIAMRWTIQINIENDWIISRDDMIQTLVNVKGDFRIDTKKPYDAAFFIDHAAVQLIINEEEPN